MPKQKMNLVFTFFDTKSGPKTILSLPEMVPEKLDETIRGFFDIELNSDNPYFEIVLLDDDQKITNLYFEIPSNWARGNQEMVMISVITGKNFNNDYFAEILQEVSNKIQHRDNIYKSLYINDVSKQNGTESNEIREKYKELQDIFVKCYSSFNKRKREEDIRNLISVKHLTLKGAQNVFDIIFIDMISCILQRKNLILFGDLNSSASIYKIISQIFIDIIDTNELMKISEEFDEEDQDSLVVNTRLGILEHGTVSKEGHEALQNYLKEALKSTDDEAAILKIRQHFSILIKISELLERILKKNETPKKIIKEIYSKMRIKINSSDLHAVRMILKGLGKNDVADKIILGTYDRLFNLNF